MKGWQKHTLFWSVVGAGFVLDQVSKHLAYKHFLTGAPVSEKLMLLPKVLSFRYGSNTGGPFSLFLGHNWLLILFSLLATAAVIAWYASLRSSSGLQTAALALIASGAFGNLCDRIFLRQVRDFINLELVHTVTGYRWPIFNLADVFICLGVGIMVVMLLAPASAHPQETAART